MKYFFIFFLFVATTSYGWACDNKSHQISDIQLHITMAMTSNQKNIGDVLYSRQSSLAELTNSSDDLLCSDVPGLLAVTGTLSGRKTGARVYQTSVPGIGIRIFYHARQPAAGEALKALPFNLNRVMRKNEVLRPEEIILRIELVKTGLVTSGKALFFHQASLLRYTIGGHTAIVNIHVIGTLPEPVCNFDSPQTIVHLPAQPLDTITAKLPTMKYPLPINISCSGEPHMMTITLNGNIYDAARGIFNIEETENSAKGVGIQFWYRDRLVRTGRALLLYADNRMDNINNTRLPFFISYIRTTKNAVPGKVKVAAVLHINYL